ncbi:transforming growth factor beta activator LRRC32 isoform X2 [Cebus imitator]|uniref:Transforming growth factor beta activator LRRC32 isoform X2 n=1 Tax=Sapajus apella TaxID=9515 RepID=A0A6J3GAW4_SAPAP|nr:transforming growth factor beta activator LRRC32 isoform X2 [Sapajus apella]XP_037596070.1 transforming growth factor beta activator LRRC32 isoform X2 [Cebus imitator]
MSPQILLLLALLTLGLAAQHQEKVPCKMVELLTQMTPVPHTMES